MKDSLDIGIKIRREEMKERVLIVDFNHMVHTYYNSSFRPSAIVVENGVRVEKDTTIPNGCLKAIARWSCNGVLPTAICFDRPVPARKAFYQNQLGMTVGTDKEYKAGREKMPDAMYQGTCDTERILRRAGASCFAENNYEADDLVFACIQRAKEKYPGVPIDVVTNDADLLPLVDDTVSVFIRSKKGTFAENPSIEKRNYVQVTPRNFELVVSDLSAYRGFLMPYNTLLLHKLLRGDASDNFKRKDISRLFSPVKYNNMIEKMMLDDINFDEIFRYGVPQYEIRYKDTEEVFNGTLEDAVHSPDKARLYQKIKNTEELDVILEVLEEFSDINEEQLKAVEAMYWGMNLNQPYPNPDKRLSRKAYVVGAKGNDDIHGFDMVELRRICNPLRINFPL